MATPKTTSALLIAGLTAAAGRAPGQTFQGLGTLPGDTDSLGRGVSADVTVVVGAIGSSGNYHRAFRWTPTGMHEVGAGTVYAFAEAVSGNGEVVVGIANPDGTGASAFRWTNAEGVVRL